jgi:predicted amidohydrolase
MADAAPTETHRDTLLVAVAQPPCLALDVAANALAHAQAVRAAAARVVVFPEMSLTGYEFDAPTVSPDDPRLQPIVDACVATGSLALVGAPVDGADGEATRHIGILAIEPSGARVAYRKMWLGGAEAERFDPGPAPAVLEVDGRRIGLAVCKDTGVPQHAADTAAIGIDGYVAGVLEFAEDAVVPGERSARIAADHDVWVAFASFAGSTGGGYERAAGRSIIRAADGTVLAEAGAEVGEIVRATVG